MRSELAESRLNTAMRGALVMTSAGLAFAGLNVALQHATMIGGASAPAAAFVQYALALLLVMPLVWRNLGAMRTSRPGLHFLRVVLAAGGVQIWVMALSVVPIWQAVALSMTSPFFVVAGAYLFLGERVTKSRVAATCVGFAGAMVILAPWSETFTPHALLPVVSAALWAGTSLITKKLMTFEPTAGITVYMLLLLLPFNALTWGGSGFALPPAEAWAALLVAGALTALAQYLLTAAYANADASYLQPFDDLKLPFNILLGWLVFAQMPSPTFWPGALMIAAASLYLMRRES
ncbi:DMT family transporter [Aliihoeflea aestuarii]|uniref:DMT family transporter n=1 Tax=Aliihoeflea aestuarii TaxID=453840 RepID=UPI0020924431|nr:DMT family transporter [Aliihoeflea aestuarii]